MTEWSWREVARFIIIYDVLTDLGYSKQEAANLVKGYRSGGHPNSKEAKRWFKIEGSPIVMMYHRLDHQDENSLVQLRSRVVRASVSTPCSPSSVPTDWRFFLHNIKTRSSTSQRFIKDNVVKALAALKNSSEVKNAKSYIADLEKCLALLERSGHSNNSSPELHKAKQMVVGVLDSTREKCSPSAFKEARDATQVTDAAHEPARQMMGFQKMYQMSKEQFKALEQSKEEYMAAALSLKEELERKSRDDANDDEDEDDDDEDAEGNGGKTVNGEKTDNREKTDNGEKTDKEPDASESQDAPDGEVTAAADAKTNGYSTNEKSENEAPEQSVSENDGPDKAEESSEADGVEKTEKDTEAATTDGTEKAEQDSEDDASSVDPSAAAESINLTGHPTVSEKDAHLPTEPADGFPDGWVARRIPRLNPADKRTDRNWYSPKLGLKFRSKAEALRFVEKLEEAKGDEAAAMMEYHGKKKTNNTPPKPASKSVSTVALADGEVVDTKAEYDFVEDVPTAPELIRRCLAVVRALCASNTADQFVYPVDPQLYPG